MRCVIFDLDGTLADTSRDLIAAANACFRDLGLGDLLDPGTDAATAVRGAKAMLRLGFSRVSGIEDGEIDRQYPKLIDHYSKDLSTHTYLYPGAMAAVEALRGRGFAVGICTNKPEALAEALMVSLGVRAAFGSLVGADTLPVRKPDPAPFVKSVEDAGGDPARALLVGDSITDERTARAAGVPSVSVLFGPDGAEHDTLSPDAWLAHFDDLPDLAERLIP